MKGCKTIYSHQNSQKLHYLPIKQWTESETCLPVLIHRVFYPNQQSFLHSLLTIKDYIITHHIFLYTDTSYTILKDHSWQTCFLCHQMQNSIPAQVCQTGCLLTLRPCLQTHLLSTAYLHSRNQALKDWSMDFQPRSHELPQTGFFCAIFHLKATVN